MENNLRKTNSFLGKIMTTMNDNTTEEELNDLLSITLGEIGLGLMDLPERIRNISYRDYMTIMLTIMGSKDNTELEETLKDLFGDEADESFIEEIKEYFDV